MRFSAGLILLLLAPGALLRAADAPDGTQFPHTVLAVEGPDVLRIRYCGLPVQVRLANVQGKGGESEKQGLKYLKDTLKAGATVRIEVEPDAGGELSGLPAAQVFAGATHVNLELVKRGHSVTDGRSKKFGPQFQAGQMEAMENKRGVWSESAKVAVAPPSKLGPATAVGPAVADNRGGRDSPVPSKPPAPAALPESAPAGYSGPVVADLSSKEYHYPGGRFAQNIRAAARIEYKSAEEAERAGKVPSPFSFPERAKALAEKRSPGGAGGSDKIVADARQALSEALLVMQEARRQSGNNAQANANWKKAARILSEHLDRLMPVADSNPHDFPIQKLAEELSMNLYSCNKYQSL